MFHVERKNERMIFLKIGIISDTHNVLREEVISHLQGCDYIIHAGDVCKEEVINRLNQLTKTFVVRGNNDLLDLPDYLEIEMNQCLIYVVHDKRNIPDKLAGIDVVIYGHSHRYEQEEREGVLFLNPGSCGRRRFSLPLTMAFLWVEDNEIRIERINLDD